MSNHPAPPLPAVKFADSQSETNFDLACRNIPNPMGNPAASSVPMVCITGPADTGKKALALYLAATLHGVHEPPTLQAPRGENAWLKILDAAAADHSKVLLIEANGLVNSHPLAAFITAANWTFRPLHTQTLNTVPCKTLVILIGQEILLSPDLSRRARIIRLTT